MHWHSVQPLPLTNLNSGGEKSAYLRRRSSALGAVHARRELTSLPIERTKPQPAPERLPSPSPACRAGNHTFSGCATPAPATRRPYLGLDPLPTDARRIPNPVPAGQIGSSPSLSGEGWKRAIRKERKAKFIWEISTCHCHVKVTRNQRPRVQHL